MKTAKSVTTNYSTIGSHIGQSKVHICTYIQYIHPTQAFNEKACCMPELPSPLTQCPGQEHRLAMETRSRRPLPWLACLLWTPQCLPPSHQRSFPQQGQSDQGWLENGRGHKTTLVVQAVYNCDYNSSKLLQRWRRFCGQTIKSPYTVQ